MLGIQTYGALFWEILHGWAFMYPDHPPAVVRDKFWMMLQNLQVGCPLCQGHYEQYLQAHPPLLESCDAFARWMVDFHNDVNRRLGRPQMTFEEAKQRFLYKSTQVKRIHLVYETRSGHLVDGRTMVPLSSGQLSQLTASVKAQELKHDPLFHQNPVSHATPTGHTNTNLPPKTSSSSFTSQDDDGSTWTTVMLVILVLIVLPLLMFGLSKWFRSI